MKKPIQVTSLNMRFCENDGWSLDVLLPYLSGTLEKKDFSGSHHYWILEPGSKLDIDRLVADGHVGDLYGHDHWDELKGMSKIEILKNRNWE